MFDCTGIWYLQIIIVSPVQSHPEVFVATVHVWISSQRCYGPVTNRNPDEVEAFRGNIAKVVCRDPSAPVLLETACCFIGAEGLSKSILIYDVVRCRLKKRRGNPWLASC